VSILLDAFCNFDCIEELVSSLFSFPSSRCYVVISFYFYLSCFCMLCCQKQLTVVDLFCIL